MGLRDREKHFASHITLCVRVFLPPFVDQTQSHGASMEPPIESEMSQDLLGWRERFLLFCLVELFLEQRSGDAIFRHVRLPVVIFAGALMWPPGYVLPAAATLLGCWCRAKSFLVRILVLGNGCSLLEVWKGSPKNQKRLCDGVFRPRNVTLQTHTDTGRNISCTHNEWR